MTVSITSGRAVAPALAVTAVCIELRWPSMLYNMLCNMLYNMLYNMLCNMHAYLKGACCLQSLLLHSLIDQNWQGWRKVGIPTNHTNCPELRHILAQTRDAEGKYSLSKCNKDLFARAK